MEKQNLWTEEEVTLLKFYYSVKDSKSWKEISNEMKEFTGIERTTTSLMSKINKLNKEDLTKDNMKKLYDDMVLNRKHGFYSIKFTKFVTDKFSKFYGDPNDIKEDFAMKKLKAEENTQIKEVILNEEVKGSSEDEYSDWTLGSSFSTITMWTIGIIAAIFIVYVGYIYFG